MLAVMQLFAVLSLRRTAIQHGIKQRGSDNRPIRFGRRAVVAWQQRG